MIITKTVKLDTPTRSMSLCTCQTTKNKRKNPRGPEAKGSGSIRVRHGRLKYDWNARPLSTLWKTICTWRESCKWQKNTHTHTLASQQTVVGKEQYHPHEQLTLNGLLRPSFHRYICSSNGSTKKTMIRVYIYRYICACVGYIILKRKDCTAPSVERAPKLILQFSYW